MDKYEETSNDEGRMHRHSLRKPFNLSSDLFPLYNFISVLSCFFYPKIKQMLCLFHGCVKYTGIFM